MDRGQPIISGAELSWINAQLVETWIEPPVHLTGCSPNAQGPLRHGGDGMRARRLRFHRSPEVECLLAKVWAHA
jgi:hypothetical protein